MAMQNRVYMQIAHNVGVVVDEDFAKSSFHITVMLGAGGQGVTLARFTVTSEEFDILRNADQLGVIGVGKFLKRVEREACEDANVRLAKLILKEGK